VTVTNTGSTATVGLTDPLPILYGGTGATALPSGCVISNGTALSTQACPTSAPTVSITSGPGIAVATPSPGVFVISNTGVQALTAGSNINPITGATPTVGTTLKPTFDSVVANGTDQANYYAAGLDSLHTEQGFSATSSGAAYDAPNSFNWANTVGLSRTALGVQQCHHN
jgi:hypothetical protein